MEWKRVKTIMIALLLVTNVIMATNLLTQSGLQRQSELDALENALEFAQKSGIAIEYSLLLNMPTEMYYYSVPEDESLQRQFADSLLGEGAALTKPGGGVSIYQSGENTVTFRRGAAVEVILMQQNYTAEQLSQTLSAFGQVGISGNILTLVGNSSMQYPLTNNSIDFTLGEQNVTANGRLALQQDMEQGDFGVSRAQMVLSATQHLLQIEATRIDALSAAYFISDFATDGTYLIPVWLIESDAGEFMINAYDGTILQ